jgi:hypothetical protein
MTANLITTRIVYAVDAAGSLGLGALLIAFANPAAALFGPSLPAVVLLAIGIGLVPWAAFNAWIATRPDLPSGAARVNVAGDAAWVVASLALLLLASAGLTMLGAAAVIAIGLFVGAIGSTKAMGLRAQRVYA